MTSNGLALHRKLPELVENGLTHLNLRWGSTVYREMSFSDII